MYKVIKKDNSVFGSYPTFSEAWRFIYHGEKIVDDKGYAFFADGTGIGFRALLQSNGFSFYAKHGIYNQNTSKTEIILANARWVRWTFGLADSLAYLQRVRANNPKF